MAWSALTGPYVALVLLFFGLTSCTPPLDQRQPPVPPWNRVASSVCFSVYDHPALHTMLLDPAEPRSSPITTST
ncbi:hypothetical protein KUCAC02_010774 [Chaenocephalus aceratus]|uniref:Uncharacterized protein n=1 Tax=Chaenocephalus aceratus TaxID=36190 RepID=A0ACB9WVC7_CHAAC|nr:hypothetical protein KUCAC02_010774 [Chaenocephalus aceratus]